MSYWKNTTNSYLSYLFQELVLSALALRLKPVEGLADVVDLVLDQLDRVDFVLDGDHVPLHLTHLALTGLHARITGVLLTVKQQDVQRWACALFGVFAFIIEC